MPFISNAERERRIEKLQRTSGGRKFIIILTIILFTAFTTLISLSLVLSASIHENDAWYAIIKSIDQNRIDLTPFGWAMFVVAVLAIVLGLYSIIILFTMKSSKKVYQEASALASTPLSGRRTTRKTAKEARSRLTSPSSK